MEKLNVWDSNVAENVNYFNLEELIEYIRKEKITRFYVVDEFGLEDGKAPSNFVNIFNLKANEHNFNLVYFDENHHTFTDNYFHGLCVEKSFFDKNKDQIINAVAENLFEKESCVYVNKYVYSESLVKNLTLTADSITFGEGIELSDEIISLLKYNRIDSTIIKNGKEQVVSTSSILGNDYDMVITGDKPLSINVDITDFENLALIPPHKTIKIINGKFEDMSEDELEDAYNIISKLRGNGQENEVVILIENRRNFIKSKVYKSDFKNIKINGIDYITYKLEDLKEEEKMLNLMVQDIKNSNFSPLEKYIAVYNIVKKFKEYKENKDDKNASRKINLLLNNEYMVCVGYAKLLEELLYRVGINSYHYSVSTDVSYDDGFTVEEKSVDLSGHARLIVNINDPKYDINGLYVADPTWDNDLKKDYYNYALMSFDKTALSDRYFRLSNEDLLINVNSMEEFIKNVNFLIDREKNEDINMAIYNDEKQAEFSAYKFVVEVIKKLLSSLNKEIYKELKNKYPYIEDLNRIKEDGNRFNYLNDFLTEVGYFFVENHGKDVSLETIIDAASEVNKSVFGFNDEQAKILKEELLEQNINRDKKCFPYYYEEQISQKVA